MQNKANWRDESRGPIVPNKPNSCRSADPEVGVPGRVDCAKQTQFPRRCPWDGAARARDAWQMCKTNPVSTGPTAPIRLEPAIGLWAQAMLRNAAPF